MDRIEKQTQILAEQLQKVNEAQTDKEYINELEKYNLMVKGADFSIKAQAESKRKKLTRKDKILAPKVNWLTKQVNKVNKKLEEHNKREGINDN